MTAPLRRWLIGSAKRRLKRRLVRELEEYRLRDVTVRPFNTRVERMSQKQVFRSLIQVNFYARERDE